LNSVLQIEKAWDCEKFHAFFADRLCRVFELASSERGGGGVIENKNSLPPGNPGDRLLFIRLRELPNYINRKLSINMQRPATS
jgi:hypothetical protein